MPLRLLLVVFVLACCQAAFGQEEPTVKGTATVPDRSVASRNEAMPAALAAALQRMSPQENPAEHLDLAGALAASETLLQRFEYQQVTRRTASGIPSIRLLLQAWFRAVPARELLVRAGLPVWRGGAATPTLYLLDESDEHGRRLYGADATAVHGLVERLDPRGVRILWPLNDLDDLRMVDALDRDERVIAEALADAAARSAADPAVLAWARHGGEQGSSVDWYLPGVEGRDAAPLHFTSSGGSLDEALVNGAPRLLAVLAERQAVQPGAAGAGVAADVDRGAGEYRLWLEQLDRAGAYAQATALLSAQPMVTAVTPEQADGHRVRVRVQIDAPLSQLLALLAADGRLLPVATPPGDADLSLRWQD